MKYRLYRRDAVKRGNWYLGVSCSGCNKPIYLVDDASEGRGPYPVVDAPIVTSCRLCGHDAEYLPETLAPVQANEDRPSSYPDRPNISKSSRKPIWKAFPRARATFGVGYIEDRPASAAIVGRIVTAWADIEVVCSRLLAELMSANARPAAAVFGSLRSSRAQHDALDAVAKVILEEQDYELFSAYMARRSSLEKERNDLAHGSIGVSPGIPDGIVWVDQMDYVIFSAKRPPSDDEMEAFRRKQFVYENGTLERLAQEISEFFDQMNSFIGYIRARNDGQRGATFRAGRYPQLCSQPHIRQALERIRTAKANA